MKKGPTQRDLRPDHAVPAIVARRRLHELQSLPRSHSRYTSTGAFVVALALAFGATGHAGAQELMTASGCQDAHPAPGLLRRLCQCFSPNDGIPRTFSYYYTPGLNQPRHFRVVRPDGKKYWTSTVRGLPMGHQWVAD
jgi:hypothetical protein